jgi:hypothetical protein
MTCVMENSLEASSKAARKIVVQSGMRVGRTGMMLAFAGALVASAAFAVDTPFSKLGIVVGLLAFLAGIVPVIIGWSQSRQGAPFLRALSEPAAVSALLLDPKALPGNRRSLSLLLADGAHQTVALKEEDARTVLDVVSKLSPKAETGEREAAQRVVAQLIAA